MRIKRITINKTLLFDFISVTFAVFLGLMLSQWNENIKNQKLASRTISNIYLEVSENKIKVQEMISYQESLMVKIDSLIDMLDRNEKIENSSLDINFKLINSASWETAKLTQAIAYIDIELVSDIASLYNAQSYYESIIKDYLKMNIYSKPQALDKDYLDGVQFFLESVLALERSMLDYYCYMLTDALIQ